MSHKSWTNWVKGGLEADEKSIISWFAAMEGAITIPTKYGNAVYVPPKREDSVLLVAHTDTVWGNTPVKVKVKGDIMYSGNKKIGIGADDRAGVAALAMLKDEGHAMLIVPEEETGCNGSREFAKICPDLIEQHRYAIQFDRRGGSDLVRYECDNPDFDDYLLKNLGGYDLATGSFSDICELCPAGGIAGVNISIGFMREHTTSETLNLKQWHNTVMKVKLMIAHECPKFEYIEALNTYGNLSWGGGGYEWAYDAELLGWKDHFSDIEKEVLWCPDCAYEVVLDEDECSCPVCGNSNENMYYVGRVEYYDE